jgi:hypothetical protein
MRAVAAIDGAGPGRLGLLLALLGTVSGWRGAAPARPPPH